MTLYDLFSAAKKSFSSFGKSFFNDGLHMGMNIGRNISVKGREAEFQGAMYSAILDHKVCAYCSSLDGMKIKLSHPDYKSGKYNPPQHKHCRCVWIYIHKDEPKPKWNWKSPAVSGTSHYHDNDKAPGLSKVTAAISNLVSVSGASEVFKLFK